MRPDLTWKNVLYPHGWVGSIWNMRGYASQIGYPYFCWNDMIFPTEGMILDLPIALKEDIK
jgi:hypothetical protein